MGVRDPGVYHDILLSLVFLPTVLHVTTNNGVLLLF